MKKLLMIIGAALFMVACGGNSETASTCESECKKECCSSDEEGKCGDDCEKACCNKDDAHGEHAHHEGHEGEEAHACEAGCKKACCSKDEDPESIHTIVLSDDGETATLHSNNGETMEMEVTEEAEITTEH